MITVMVADDQPIFREGVKKILMKEDDIHVIEEAGNGRDAINKALQLKPDILLLNISMPVNGIRVTRELKKFGCPTKIIAITGQGEKYEKAMMHIGATKYCTKNILPEALVRLIRATYRSSNEPMGDSKYHEQLFSLTERERDIAKLLVSGSDNISIAKMLGISEKTVKNHLSKLFSKLEVKDRASAIAYINERIEILNAY